MSLPIGPRFGNFDQDARTIFTQAAGWNKLERNSVVFYSNKPYSIETIGGETLAAKLQKGLKAPTDAFVLTPVSEIPTLYAAYQEAEKQHLKGLATLRNKLEALYRNS